MWGVAGQVWKTGTGRAVLERSGDVPNEEDAVLGGPWRGCCTNEERVSKLSACKLQQKGNESNEGMDKALPAVTVDNENTKAHKRVHTQK